MFGLSCSSIRENDQSEGIVKPIKDAMRREIRKVKLTLEKQMKEIDNVKGMEV